MTGGSPNHRTRKERSRRPQSLLCSGLCIELFGKGRESLGKFSLADLVDHSTVNLNDSVTPLTRGRQAATFVLQIILTP